MITQKPFSGARPPAGEVTVWLTAMGLATGLVLILGLLLLIFFKGVLVFWPARVVELTLASSFRGTNVVAGEIVQLQELSSAPANADGTRPLEIQVFLGNRDAYGSQNFSFIPLESVVAKHYPEDILVVERMEYGDGIFYPRAVVLGDGTRVEFGDAKFESTLEATLAKARKLRHELKTLRTERFGDLNREVTRLDLRLRILERRNLDEARKQEIQAPILQRKAELDAKFKELSAESARLEAALKEDVLEVRLPTGEIEHERFGELINIYRPNQLSVFGRASLFFSHIFSFLSEDPREANTEGGIFPAIFGTFAMTLLMSIAVTPFGVIAAIYLREYAKQGPLVRMVRISVNNLAGVPSIVFGVFGLGFFVYVCGGTLDRMFFSDSLPTPTIGTGGIMWAALTLALLNLPVVIVATEEAIAAVPRGVREAALACGASKWQAIQRVVLPAAAPGILTGLILAMARGAGEVAPLMIVGVVKLAPTLPIDAIFPFVHPERKFMHLGFHIYDLGFQSPDSEAAKPMVYATTFFLIVLVVLLNVGAISIRNHLRRKYASSAF